MSKLSVANTYRLVGAISFSCCYFAQLAASLIQVLTYLHTLFFVQRCDSPAGLDTMEKVLEIASFPALSSWFQVYESRDQYAYCIR
jgi:hypothetical protein